jgi:ribosomal subunit interface protein
MLKIQIRAGELRLTDVLRARVERRLGLALGRFGERIGRVIVRFSEPDGHQRCEIEVSLRPHVVRVEVTDADALAAVDHAIDRAAGSVGRALDRERERDGRPTEPRTLGGSKK